MGRVYEFNESGDEWVEPTSIESDLDIHPKSDQVEEEDTPYTLLGYLKKREFDNAWKMVIAFMKLLFPKVSYVDDSDFYMSLRIPFITPRKEDDQRSPLIIFGRRVSVILMLILLVFTILVIGVIVSAISS